MNEQQTAPTQKSGGSNKTVVTVIIIVVAVLLVLGVGGYFLSRYLAQKAAESLVSGLTGGKVTTQGDDGASLNLGDTSIKTGSLASWPTDLPISLQQPEDVTVKSTSKIASSQTWIVNIADIPTNAIDNYITDLEGKGWTKTSDDNIVIRMIILTKDSWQLGIGYDEPNRSAQLTISPK